LLLTLYSLLPTSYPLLKTMYDLLGRTFNADTQQQQRLFAKDEVNPNDELAMLELNGEMSLVVRLVNKPKGLKVDRKEIVDGKTVTIYKIDETVYNNRCDIAGAFPRNRLDFDTTGR